MEYERRATHLGGHVAHVQREHLLEKAHRDVRRDGEALRLVERALLLGGGVVKQLRDEDLPERRAVGAPAELGGLEHGLRLLDDLLRRIALEQPARAAAVEHEAADSLGCPAA